MELYFISHSTIYPDANTSLIHSPEYVVDAYISCIWTKRFCAYNDFQVQLPATKQNMENIQMYDLVYRSTDRLEYTPTSQSDYGFPPLKTVMMIEKIEIEDNDDKHIMTISGRGFEAWFARLITWNKATLQGKLKSVINTLLMQNSIINAETQLEAGNYWWYVNQMCQASGDYTDYIPRQCRNYYVEVCYDDTDPLAYNDDIVCDTVSDYLGDTLTQILKPLGYDWYFYFKPAKVIHSGGPEGDWTEFGWDVELHIRKPNRRADVSSGTYSILFSKDNGMLLSSKYTQDSTQSFNCGLILGEGTGADQIRVAYPQASSLASLDNQPKFYARHESIVDNSSFTADTIVLVDQYKRLLIENTDYQAVKNNAQSMEVEINAMNTMYKYGNDSVTGQYDVGTIVGFKTETGIMATARIVEMIESEDGDGTKLTPTFDEWEFAS